MKEFGSVNSAIVFHQIAYWIHRGHKIIKGKSHAKFSYRNWQRQMPWISTRQLMRMVKFFEKEDVFRVTRTGGANLIHVGEYKYKYADEPQFKSWKSIERHLKHHGLLVKGPSGWECGGCMFQTLGELECQYDQDKETREILQAKVSKHGFIGNEGIDLTEVEDSALLVFPTLASAVGVSPP